MDSDSNNPGRPGARLRDLRPRYRDDFLSRGDDPAADTLLDSILEAGDGVRPRRRRRIPFAVIVVSTAAIAGASGAAAWLLSRAPSDPTAISCWASSDPVSTDRFELTASSQVEPQVRCAELWNDGTISSTGAPPLVTCIGAGGLVTVVPGSEGTCGALGFAIADRSADEPTRVADLGGQLSELLAGECLGPDEAIAATQEVLDQLGLDGWTIESPDTLVGCAAASIDAPSQQVRLIFVPPPPST